jgi:hypothetical protein
MQRVPERASISAGVPATEYKANWRVPHTLVGFETVTRARTDWRATR